MKRIVRESTWVMSGQIIAAVVGMVGIRIITELAPKEVLGEATLLMGAVTLGRNIFVAPFNNAQLRYHPDYASRGLARWYTYEMWRWTWLGSLGFAIFGSLAFFLWRYWAGDGLRLWLYAAMLLLLLADTMKGNRINRLNAERRQAIFSAWSVTETILLVAVPALALYGSAKIFHYASVEAYIFGWGFGGLLATLVFGFLLYPPFPVTAAAPDQSLSELSREVRKKTFKFGLPFVPTAILSWISTLGDRYLLGALMSTAAVGQFSAVSAIASRPFLMISGFLSTVLRPVLFVAETSGDAQKARRVAQWWALLVLGIGITGIILFILLGNWVARLLLAEPYREGAANLFVWFSIGYAFFACSQSLENILLSKERSRGLILPLAVSTVASLALLLILVPHYSVTGAAASKTAGFIVQLGLLLATIFLPILAVRREQQQKV